MEEMREYGWEPLPLKILRQDIPTYVDADQDIINKSLRIGYQESMVDYLESIIKQITNRGFQLKTIVDWERFRTGLRVQQDRQRVQQVQQGYNGKGNN